MKLSPLRRTALILCGSALLLGTSLRADDATNSDNSGNNVPDRSADAITPASQSNESADIAVTAKIRRAVVKDESLSVDAHNIKIITTKDHIVYLRGVVASDRECKRIEKIARMHVGDYQLKNDLTVK